MSSDRKTSRRINTRVVLDIASGAVLDRESFLYRGPLALAEAGTAEAKLAELTTQLEAANKRSEEAIAEAAKFRKTATELQGKVMSDEDRKAFEDLKAAAAKAEEERARKAGEFDTLKAQMVDKHTKELQERDSKISTLSERIQTTLKRAEFGAASDLFGTQAKTIFDADMAIDVLGKYVHVEDTENGGHRVVVKNTKGQVIVGKDGEPLPFAAAMAELIESLPNKDRILRGSGKTGSGSSGGAGGGAGGEDDITVLTAKANAGDKDALERLKKKQSALGGIRMGA